MSKKDQPKIAKKQRLPFVKRASLWDAFGCLSGSLDSRLCRALATSAEPLDTATIARMLRCRKSEVTKRACRAIGRGWVERVNLGLYRLSAKGRAAWDARDKTAQERLRAQKEIIEIRRKQQEQVYAEQRAIRQAAREAKRAAKAAQAMRFNAAVAA